MHSIGKEDELDSVAARLSVCLMRVAGVIFLGSTHPYVAACHTGGGTTVPGEGAESLAAPWQVLWVMGIQRPWGWKMPSQSPYPTRSFDRRQHWLKGVEGNSSGTCSYSPNLHIAVFWRSQQSPAMQRQVGWRWLYMEEGAGSWTPWESYAYKEMSFAVRQMRNLNLSLPLFTVSWLWVAPQPRPKA